MNPDLYPEILKSTKPLAIDRVARYQYTHELLIDKVKQSLASFPEDYAITQEYMWFAQRLWGALQRYTSSALQKEVDATYLYYLAKGLKDVPMRLVARSLGLKISPIEVIMEKIMAPVLMNVVSKGTIVASDEEQLILDYTGDISVIQGYIDLSKMDIGDTIEVKLYVKIKPDGDYKLYKTETYIAPLSEELLYVLPRLSGYGLRVTIRQIAGSFKSFDYLFAKSP